MQPGGQQQMNPLYAQISAAAAQQQYTGPKKKFESNQTLYVGNLSLTTYDNDLYKHFFSKGYKLSNARVMIDQKTNQSKGYGYLNFYSAEEAQRCLDTCKNTTIDGRQIVISHKKDSDFDQNANILVKNLPKDFSQDQLHEMFKEYGEIQSCKLDINNDGSSRQQGYVQYKSQESA